MYKFAKEESSTFDLPKNVSNQELSMIEFGDITILFGLLESFTIGLGIESFSFFLYFCRNSLVDVSVGVEAIVIGFEVEGNYLLQRL